MAIGHPRSRRLENKNGDGHRHPIFMLSYLLPSAADTSFKNGMFECAFAHQAWASIEDYFSKISGIKEQQQNSKRSKSKVLWSWRKSIKDARSTNNNAKSPKKGIYEFNRVAVTRSTNNNAKSQSSFNKLHIYPKVFSAAIDSYAFSKISN